MSNDWWYQEVDSKWSVDADGIIYIISVKKASDGYHHLFGSGQTQEEAWNNAISNPQSPPQLQYPGKSV